MCPNYYRSSVISIVVLNKDALSAYPSVTNSIMGYTIHPFDAVIQFAMILAISVSVRDQIVCISL